MNQPSDATCGPEADVLKRLESVTGYDFQVFSVAYLSAEQVEETEWVGIAKPDGPVWTLRAPEGEFDSPRWIATKSGMVPTRDLYLVRATKAPA